MEPLHRRILQFIRRQRLLKDGDSVVVGLSGGPDSVALVLILLDLSEGGKLALSVHLAHLNHGLRGAESDAEEGFCREFARRYGLDLEVAKAAVADARGQGESIEAAARRIRYKFLARVAAKTGASAIATGHHADDVAESVLLRMIRGAGLTGLGAIAPQRPLSKDAATVRLVRPLLKVRKADLLEFLRARGEAFCTDSSNFDTDYTRNRIRHILLPALERDFPTFSVRSLCTLNEAAVEAARLFEELLDGLWGKLCRAEGPDEVVLDAEAIAEASPVLRKAAAGRALGILAEGEAVPALGSGHYDDLAALPHREVGTEVSLPGGFFARHEHGLVYFSRRGSSPVMPTRELPVPGAVDLPEVRTRISCEMLPPAAVSRERAAELASEHEVYLDQEAVAAPLKVRSRRPGDKFQPLGYPAPTRLKDFLIGQKVPLHRRDLIPLVTTRDGAIVWVVGHRIGEQFKLLSADRPALCLKAKAINKPQAR